MLRWSPAIVATAELFGSCAGSWSAGSGGADGEAGVVHAVDRAGHLERGGLPDRRRESADREALATRAHSRQRLRTMYHLAETGQIPCRRLGTVILVPVAWVEREPLAPAKR
jgi:hypothetical protein